MKVTQRSEGAVCNLCHGKFKRTSIFTRFCDNCRQTELYRFSDYLALCTQSYEEEELVESFQLANRRITA